MGRPVPRRVDCMTGEVIRSLERWSPGCHTAAYRRRFIGRLGHTFFLTKEGNELRPKEQNANVLSIEDKPIHDWYRFVLSFPPHLVRDYLEKFGASETDRVFDPFCGTGTTLVECKKLGISSVGIEANAMTHFASTVKLNWAVDPAGLVEHTLEISEKVRSKLEKDGINDDANLFSTPAFDGLETLSEAEWKIMLKDSISPLPLHKILVLLSTLKQDSKNSYYDHERLALAKAIVHPISNLRFAPEVSIGEIKQDTPTLVPWITNVRAMSEDLQQVRKLARIPAIVRYADARQITNFIEPASVDIVITSPPYPNEKDYTRITRLESILLGFIQSRGELRTLKQGLMRSNTRNVYVGDADDDWVSQFAAIQQLAAEIEARRIELGKSSGFEKLYGKVTKLYFGGMARHLFNLKQVLRPGARLAYVVGDQASYLRIMIRTGQLLAEIAENMGYKVEGIDLFRTRISTATGEQLREEVVLLKWNG